MGFLFLSKNNLRKNWLLGLILFLALILRFCCVYPGYYYPHGDELLYSQALYMIINKTLSFQPQYFGFPPLIPWLMIPFFVFFFIPLSWSITLVRHFSEVYMFLIPVIVLILALALILRKKVAFIRSFLFIFWLFLVSTGVFVISKGTFFYNDLLGSNWIKALYWGRYLTVLVGCGVVYLLYKIVLELFKNKKAALVGVFLGAVNYRLVLNSHVGLPDMFGTFFFLLSIFSIAKLFNNQSQKNYLFSWLAVTAAFLTKYQIHMLAPFIFTHIYLSISKSNRNFKKFLVNFFSKRMIMGGLISIVVILVTHIYHFKNWNLFLEINAYEAAKYSFGRKILDLYPISYLYHVGVGKIISLISLGGILIGLIKKNTRIQTLFLISSLLTVGYLYFFYTGGGFYTRNLIVVIPVLIIFSAIFLALIKIPKVFFVFVIFLCGLSNLKNSAFAAYFYLRGAPRVQAQKWLDKNIKGKMVFGRFAGNPAPTDFLVNLKNMPPYAKAFSYLELKKEGLDKAIIELSWVRAEFIWWMRQIPSIQIKMWHKPDDLLSQSYYALALRELLWSHGLALFITPWQAPTHQFAIVDLNSQPSYFPAREIYKTGNFADGWKKLVFLSKNESALNLIRVGNNKNLLGIEKEMIFAGGARWQSDPIQVKEGFGYFLTASIENLAEVSQEERQTFLRLDFYDEKPLGKITERPLISFVSERVFGSPQIRSFTIQGIAPEGAKYLTIGFQGGDTRSSYRLYTVNLTETLSKVTDNGQHLKIKDDDLFLFNDEGIL